MKLGYKNLSKHAEGAFLKEEYLEAFLIQACLVEGIVKDYFHFKVLRSIPFASSFSKKFENYDFSKLIDVLFLSGRINRRLFDDLHTYRKKRNEVFHKLLKQQDEKKLEEDLKKAYLIGGHMEDFIVKDLVAIMARLTKKPSTKPSKITR